MYLSVCGRYESIEHELAIDITAVPNILVTGGSTACRVEISYCITSILRAKWNCITWWLVSHFLAGLDSILGMEVEG